MGEREDYVDNDLPPPRDCLSIASAMLGLFVLFGTLLVIAILWLVTPRPIVE
jgi:hypothetical protein